MNKKIKNILLFAVCISLGLCIFLVNDSIRHSQINNLHFFLTMLSIMIIVLGFVFLFKIDDPEENIFLDETNEKNLGYIESKKQEKELKIKNIKKSIMYILLGIIIFIITAIFSLNGIILRICNIIVAILFILGMIKFDIKIENRIRERYLDFKENVNSKKGQKFKLLYLIFDYVPQELIFYGVILAFLTIGLFIDRTGVLDILKISEEQFGITIIILGFIVGMFVLKKQKNYYKKEIILKKNDKDYKNKKEYDHFEEK